jgi:hypothetical protein
MTNSMNPRRYGRRLLALSAVIGATLTTAVAVQPGAASAAENRSVCADSVAVRDSDLSHVVGYLFGSPTHDVMTVERYAHKTTNPNAVYAFGTAHTRQGDVEGYVLIDANTLCS